MNVTPYLFFNGRCDEALAFYGDALGARVEMLSRFNEAPELPPGVPASHGEKVMHVSLRIGDSVVMASDGMGGNASEFKGFSLSLDYADVDQARRAFDALAQGGRILMPMDETFFATIFGMVCDRFGVQWMVGVMQKS